MSLFHLHKWVEVSRTFTPSPLVEGYHAKGLSSDELERALYGFTTIELRCAKCGDLKHVRVIGDVPNTQETNHV